MSSFGYPCRKRSRAGAVGPVFGRNSALVFVLIPLLIAFALGPREAAAQDSSIEWIALDRGRAAAAQQEKPFFVYVRAAWCAPCYRIERETLPAIAETLNAFAGAVRIDVTTPPDPAEYGRRQVAEWLRSHGLETPPAFAVVSPAGEVRALRGYAPGDELREWLTSHMSGSKR